MIECPPQVTANTKSVLNFANKKHNIKCLYRAQRGRKIGKGEWKTAMTVSSYRVRKPVGTSTLSWRIILAGHRQFFLGKTKSGFRA